MGMLNSVMMLGNTSLLLNQAIFSLMCNIQKHPHEKMLLKNITV